MKIGEVARLLGLSPETIRYYEKEGLLKPARKEESLYRDYDSWDVFSLMDCITYRNMNFSVSETYEMIRNGTPEKAIQFFSKKREALQRELAYKQALLSTIEKISHQIDNADLNIGNYWFKRMPLLKCIPVCTFRDDEYRTLLHRNIAPWYQAEPLVRGYFHIRPESIGTTNSFFCSLAAEDHMVSFLDLPIDEHVITIPEKLYLHTFLDLGEKDSFSLDMLSDAISYAKSRDYQIDGDILGELFIRIRSNQKWHRYMQVMIPVTKEN